MWLYLEIGSLQVYLVKMRSFWIKVGPASHMTGILIKRREDHVEMEAELGAMWPQAKDCQQLQKLGKQGQEQGPAATLISGFCPPEL